MGKGTGIKDKSSVAFGKMVYGSTGQMDETMSATKNTGGGMDANQRLMSQYRRMNNQLDKI